MDEPNLSDRVAIAALAIAIVAMLAVVVQYFQSIWITASGLRSCRAEVMGLWAPKWAITAIRFRWYRLEVRYKAPVIFLASSDNQFGPVEGVGPPIYANGSNCKDTKVAIPNNNGRVHTVKNERATWVTLLEEVQRMERDSRNWAQMEWKTLKTNGKIKVEPNYEGVVTLAVAIQPIERSFDWHPAISLRPYATTAICHIVELAAVLSIYWRQFDQAEDRYHAAGNGYNLRGLRVKHFGIVFTLEVHGVPKFTKNRLIPTAEVKELCFGNVPTIFRDRSEDIIWKEPLEEQIDLKTLQLGSRREIANTLNLIGCNANTCLYYSQEGHKHIHLFPVIFEVMGMVARTFHLKERPFTYLPNPVMFPFDKRTLSFRSLLEKFNDNLAEEIQDSNYTVDERIDRISSLSADLVKMIGEYDQDPKLPAQIRTYYATILDKLHDTLDAVDAILLNINKTLVLDVLRRHIQEVLLAINTSAKDAEPEVPNLQTSPPHSTISNHEVIWKPISFDDLSGAAPEKRVEDFMRKYVDEIRIRVVSTEDAHHDAQAVEASKKIHEDQNHESQPAQQGRPQEHQEEPAQQGRPQGHQEEPAHIATHRKKTISFKLPARAGTGTSSATSASVRPPTAIEIKRNLIWCALVFRMICWLMLHDFDGKDFQVQPKSDLLGSRLPVFIV